MKNTDGTVVTVKVDDIVQHNRRGDIGEALQVEPGFAQASVLVRWKSSIDPPVWEPEHHLTVMHWA
jgi:hypothetical protein